jgi:hypothetical protein
MDLQINIEVRELSDLPKIKELAESLNIKINKSQLARDLNVSWSTIDNYLNGFVPKKIRNKISKSDELYPTIRELLSEGSSQKFYYEECLYQYLADNYQLDCSGASFRRYILKHPEFKNYFEQQSQKEA